MTSLVNPKSKIRFVGDTVLEIIGDEYTDVEIEVEIEKDLDEEPNQAEIRLYNLAESSRQIISDVSNQSAPVEIHVTSADEEAYVLAYRGEIDTARSTKHQEGHDTVVRCTSQKENHRSFFFEKTYVKGTTIDQIVNEMVEAVNLPTQISAAGGEVGGTTILEGIPTTGILMSQSFSGPAFEVLRRYVFDIGLFAYIVDGVLYISSLFEPTDPTEIEITDNMLLEQPQRTTRVDAESIEMRTVVKTTNSPLLRSRGAGKRAVLVKRKKKKTKVVGKNDYVDYDAVDKIIPGIEFILRCQPRINPDNVLKYNDRLYRVQSVATDFDSKYWETYETRVNADDFVQSDELL